MLAVFFTLSVLIRYQQALNLRYGAWLTVVTGLSITGLAIASGVQNTFPQSFLDEHISGRGVVVGTWITLEIIFIVIGVVMKVILPCALLVSLLSAEVLMLRLF